VGHALGVEADGKRLDQGGLDRRHPFRHGEATLSGEDESLGHRSCQLPGAAEKPLSAAGVRPSGEALIAPAAGNEGINRHELAWS
jgi:hypothetical protein